MKYMCSLLLLFFFLGSLQGQVAVISHKEVAVEEVSKSELYDFYTGDIRKWSNGDAVITFDLKPKGEIKDTFYEYLGTSTSRMKSIWLKKMLAGEKDPPESVPNEEEMIKKVKENPGSIGFCGVDKITDGVKVLLVIGDD
jgi:ABC-type phosphate transport system substrate-binding protein